MNSSALRSPSLLTLGVLASLGAATPATGGVWAHYAFDSDFTDSSGNNRHGTLTDVGTTGNSAITTTEGEFKFGDGAMHFAADRDYLAIPSKTFGTGSPYTIAFWAKKAPGDTGDPALWDMVIGERGNTNFFIGLNNGTGMRWRSIPSAGGIRQADFAAPDDTNWHHHALTADNSGNLGYYLDGTLVGTQTGVSTGIILDTIGEAYNTSRDFDMHGQIDEMWIFDEALDAAMIQGLYSSNEAVVVVSSDPFHFRFDDDFTDSSGNGNSGTASGAATISTAPSDIATGSGALALDGADNSFVALDASVSLGPADPWTVTFWARRGELGGQKGMVMGRRDNARDFIWLNDNFDGLRFRSSANPNVTHDFTVPQDTLLHHYALAADGAGTISLYRDGQWLEDSSGDTSFTIDTIGQAYNTLSYSFQGSLDEVQLFTSALDATEVLQIYNSEKPGPATEVTRLRVFLLGGQSNADGRAAPSSLPTSPVNLQQPQNDIDFYYRIEGGAGGLTTLRPGLTETSQFGPAITMGRRLADLFGPGDETRTAIIRYANGGTNLQNQWKAGGDDTTTGDGPDYVVFQQTVTDGLAALTAAYPTATIEIEGMAWLQGESDVAGGYDAAYQTNLTAFIADVRSTFGANLPFVIIRLSIHQTALDTDGLAVVRNAMDAIATTDPRVGLIDTDAFGMKGDNLHFDATGQQQIGSATGEEIVYLRWMLDTFPASAIDTNQGGPDADYDGDQRSNNDEFIAGTDADDPLSFLAAVLTPTAPGGFQLTYPGAADRRFAVEIWLPGSETWDELLPAETGSGDTDVRDINTADSDHLYRVRAELP